MTKTKERMNQVMKQIKENKWIHYIIIIIIGVILSMPLSQIQIRETHDGVLHMLRLIGTVDTLKIGQFPPLINQNYCNGSGYSMNLFYPPLVTYLPLLIKLFTSSYTVTLKIFGGICIVLSGVTMYQFVYQVTKKRTIALFSAIFYLIAPYKLVDVYKRFAIGEFTSFIFIPFVFLGLVNLFEQDQKKHYFIAIGAIGLMLSHTITTLYTCIFCIVYILFHMKQLKNKEIIKKCFINVIFILLVSMFFWLPLLETTTMTDYAIMDDKIIHTNGEYVSSNTISFIQFWNDIEKNGITFKIGAPTIIVIVLTIFVLKKVDKKYNDFYLISIIFSLFSLCMVTKFFPWKIMPNLLCKLQYPWRMIGFFYFFTSFICGINLYIILKQLIKKDGFKILLVLLFIVWAIFSSLGIMSQYRSLDQEKDKKYENSILENKKISHKQINREYMPIKALLLQNTYVMTREDKTYVLKGNAQITKETKQNLQDELEVQNIEINTQLEFPYYYYPGYEITIVTEGKEEKIKAVESDNGYVSCFIEKEIEQGTILVKYVGTTITYISYGISAISFIIFIGYMIEEKRKEKKNG